MKTGDKAKIKKRTFLHKGIFVHTGSYVVVKEILDNGRVVAEYLDREGFPHLIEFSQDELEEAVE